MLAEKQILENKYEIKKKINNSLYEAVDLRMMIPWAVKEISWEELHSRDINEEDILAELEQMKKINHRIFPKVIELIKTEDAFYVVMELTEGKKVSEMEDRDRYKITDWTMQLCDGLKTVEELQLKHIAWGVEELRIEDGNIRLQDFDTVQSQPDKKESIRETAALITYGNQTKLTKKLQRMEPETYEQLMEALERYMIETAKKQKMKKRICSAGAVAAMIIIVCFMGIKVFNGKKVNIKRQAEPPKQTEDVSDTEEKENGLKQLQVYTNEVADVLKEKQSYACIETLKPEKTKTPGTVSAKQSEKVPTAIPKTEMPVKVPAVTQEAERTKEPVKAPVMEQPQKTERPILKSVTAQPQKKETASKLKEKTEKPGITEAPQSVEIELEDNSMEIIVK